MSFGSLKTLFTMLQEAPSLSEVSVVFGEENIIAQDQNLPMVVMVPVGGPLDMPGYFVDADPNIDNQWFAKESVDLYLWAYSLEQGALPIDHADAVEDLRRKVLQAFQTQQPFGLKYRPVTGRWQLADNVLVRYGRGYVLTVEVDVSIPGTFPINADILHETINKSIT